MMRFPTSLRRTAYVAPKALKGWVKNAKLAIFDDNRTSAEKKSATVYLRDKSGKVVGHSLPYITLHKWFVGDAPFNVNSGVKLNPPVPKQSFRSSLVLQLHVRKQLIYSLKTTTNVGISPAPRSLCDRSASCSVCIAEVQRQ